MADTVVKFPKDLDKRAIKEKAAEMITTLDTIQTDVVGSTAAQTQQAIKRLAEHQEKIVRFIARNL